ncbi:MAG: hypothetical protein V3V18_09690 [Methylococcales bacterium]
MQRTPAGFPLGIPGIGEEIVGAIQQAPQPVRHVIIGFCILSMKLLFSLMMAAGLCLDASRFQLLCFSQSPVLINRRNDSAITDNNDFNVFNITMGMQRL